MEASTSRSIVWNDQLMQIFTSMRSMSLSLSGPFSRTNVDVDDIYSLERRIVVLLAETNPALHTQELQAGTKGQLTIYQNALAALAYLYLFFRDNLVRAPLFSVLVARLAESLVESNRYAEAGKASTPSPTTNIISSEENIKFWVVVVGALIATGRTERSLFVEELRKLGEQMRVQTFEDYVQVLKKTAWIENREDGFLWLLCREVQSSS